MTTQRKITRRAQKAWDRLKSWYGTRLADSYGDAPPEDWCELIDRTDPERLEEALATVRSESPVYPPTLGQLEASVPKRRDSSGPSMAFLLSEHAVKKLQTQFCPHQLRGPWNYFGPVREYKRLGTKSEAVKHPEVRGVHVPACQECGKPTHRFTVDDLVSEGVAA
jgi:hypothetical protein